GFDLEREAGGGRSGYRGHIAAAAKQMRDATLMSRSQKLVVHRPAVVGQPARVIGSDQRGGLFHASRRWYLFVIFGAWAHQQIVDKDCMRVIAIGMRDCEENQGLVPPRNVCLQVRSEERRVGKEG